jgi:hypothetical protein
MLNKQNYPVNMGRDYVRGGRGQEGQGYRGGRGNGRFSGRFQGKRSWNSTSSSTKQPEMKFFPHGIGRGQQAVSYDTVKDHIVQYVQKTYRNGQDDAVSIRNLVVMDLTPHKPTRGISRDVDATANLKAQAGKIFYTKPNSKGILRERIRWSRT